MNNPTMETLARRLERVERENWRMKRVGVVALALIAAVVLMGQATARSVAFAESQAAQGERLCRAIERNLNQLVDYTKTKCTPAGGRRKGTVSFILISEKPVFSAAAAAKGWLISAVGTVGHLLNAEPSIKADEIIVSDIKLMGNRKGFILLAAVAKRIQRQVKDGEINLEQFYSRLIKALTTYNIPAK